MSMKDAMENKRDQSMCLAFSSRYIQRNPHTLIATAWPTNQSFEMRTLIG